jgi:hypothetical protein
MRVSVRLLTVSTLAACGGAPLATTVTAPSPAPAPDVFQCARNNLKAIDFSQSSYDTEEQRLNARRFDYETSRPDVTFRRIVDRLEVQATPGDSGAMTTLKITARTFGEYVTQRGPTEVEESASETARNAAQKLLDLCITPADSTRVPGT